MLDLKTIEAELAYPQPHDWHWIDMPENYRSWIDAASKHGGALLAEVKRLREGLAGIAEVTCDAEDLATIGSLLGRDDPAYVAALDMVVSRAHSRRLS